MRERDIERYLVAEAKARGGEVRKVKWVGRRGAPDRLVLLGTRGFWVELKAPGVAAEDYQLREHARMRAFGCEVFVIDSLDGVDHVLDT